MLPLKLEELKEYRYGIVAVILFVGGCTQIIFGCVALGVWGFAFDWSKIADNPALFMGVISFMSVGAQMIIVGAWIYRTLNV
jgi:hypothetical protein